MEKSRTGCAAAESAENAEDAEEVERIRGRTFRKEKRRGPTAALNKVTGRQSLITGILAAARPMICSEESLMNGCSLVVLTVKLSALGTR